MPADGAHPLRPAHRHLPPLRLQPGTAAQCGPRCGGRGPEVREQRHLLSVHPRDRADHGGRDERPLRHRQAGRHHHADGRRLPRHELHLAHSQGAGQRGPVARAGDRAVVQGPGRGQPRFQDHAEDAPAGRVRAHVRRFADDVPVPHAPLRGGARQRERAVRPVDGHLQGTAASRREARGVQAHGARHRGGLRHAAARGRGHQAARGRGGRDFGEVPSHGEQPDRGRDRARGLRGRGAGAHRVLPVRHRGRHLPAPAGQDEEERGGQPHRPVGDRQVPRAGDPRAARIEPL